MANDAATIMVFFNLKEGVVESDYLKWAREIDLPTVNALNSVASFEVLKGKHLMGTDTPSPWQYFEVIKLHSQQGFAEELTSDTMGKVIEQFQSFAADAHFVVTETI